MERAAPTRATPPASDKPIPVAHRPRGIATSFARVLAAFAGPPGPRGPAAAHGLQTKRPVGPEGDSVVAAQARALPHGARATRDHEHDRVEERESRAGARAELDAGDAAWAHRAALVAPPPGDVQAASRAHVEQVTRHASVEELAPVLLRKMAWSGDGRRGAARLELGSGSLAGAVVTLEAEHGVVALAVEGLDAREESSLRARLAQGLEARGFRLAP